LALICSRMEQLLTTDNLLSLLSLTLMEVVLGIDNIIFISIVAGKLPPNQQNKARQLGLLLALGVRILLLFGISYIISFNRDLFSIRGTGISGRDLILLAGGLFLMGKTVSEIHGKLEGEAQERTTGRSSRFFSVLVQIVLVDIVFSFDSILTAIGLSDHVEIMVAAVLISMAVMMVYARRISVFINRRPTLKMLALCFLIVIGFLLVAEAFDVHVPKSMVYFGMVFAMAVELLNIQVRKKTARPVRLREELPVKDTP
jgi:predicted tellurium resistance membrane protein TerC